ncbi:MAG: IS200/IS605 family transposase [Bacteroidetes bacterium]|nr:IS200/IS605 family transposase [Bacteroidota bacterium]
MADTYSQIYIQLVFAVKGKHSLITESIKVTLYKYISGIVQNQKQKLYIINGMPDHLHILVSISPGIAISSLVREIKEHSTKFINTNSQLTGKFQWQEGFGAFSYSKSQLPDVVEYIRNQEVHHAQKSFRDEYLDLLNKNEIKYKDEYLFDWLDYNSNVVEL